MTMTIATSPLTDPEIELILAAAENGVIGSRGQLPFRVSSDLKRFRALTMGHAIVMGRKTHESIGKTLDGRLNVVLSRNSAAQLAPGARLCSDLDAAIELVRSEGHTKLFIIGGGQLYAISQGLARRIHLTRVHCAPEGDTFFELLEPAIWTCSQSEQVDGDSARGDEVGHEYKLLERIESAD